MGLIATNSIRQSQPFSSFHLNMLHFTTVIDASRRELLEYKSNSSMAQKHE